MKIYFFKTWAFCKYPIKVASPLGVVKVFYWLGFVMLVLWVVSFFNLFLKLFLTLS